MQLGLYIHIPFCQQKCLYCDFPSYSHMESLYESYTNALCREITGQGVLFSGHEVDTIYIGGGTPTLLPLPLLLQVITAVQTNFYVTPDAEVSMEANPGTVDGGILADLRAHGINRMSFGVQSFTDILLQEAGRIHSAEEGIAAVRAAQQAGFSNINIDLMYGLPLQTLKNFQDSLRQAVELAVPHISVYGLKVEEGTPFAHRLAAERLLLPAEEEEEAMYEEMVRLLPECGYKRYEISNYAAQGQLCRHNLKYWNYSSYLGLGAAAHSFLNRERLANTRNVRTYIEQINSGGSPVEYQEKPGVAEQMAEFCFLGLRTAAGISYEAFYQYFEKQFPQHFSRQVAELAAKNLIDVGKESVKLTPLGMKYGNLAFQAFLP
ncbi:radical SAM family heme chaperone HemW [Anaerospora hongkongensis]|uniref:radical SAM family heme chaperone HemW n=1 Tax=Anaerospora hongkongensis TaxID=244830 RepID=UPI00289B0FC5|nr:radical SAM family heme chaperone HemW [Anaerospora hongkongensis]